jgi:NADH:ubiquinone oxidoreductase subunit 5 (subunit L)/multisubunit Na+/H+ antiporter MnhA subunit
MAAMLIWILIAIAVIVGVAYLAKWIIETFIPEPARKAFMFITGVVLLILLIIGVAGILGGGAPAIPQLKLR